MIVRAIDANNDWQFGKGKNDYRTDILAVSQNIKTRLQSFLGDCFFKTDEGIDWFNLLGSKDLEALKLAINTTILNTQDVVKLNEVSANLDKNRNLTVIFDVLTTFGQAGGTTTISV